MLFEWDERKRLANLAKHRLDFADVDLVFDQPYLRLAGRPVGAEIRHRAIGSLGESLVAVIFTMRGETVRIISMRKARDDERRRFHQAIHGR
jgi:uncharacterized DUF497 family protein